MEKSLTRFRLLLKRRLTDPVYLASVLMMVLMLILAAATGSKAEGDRPVLFVNEAGETGEELLLLLSERDSIFAFREAESVKKLKNDVMTGRADSGFVFGEDLPGALERGERLRLIVQYTSPYSVNAKVARETVFAAFYRMFASSVLSAQADTFFGDQADLIREELLERKEEWYEGDAVLRLIYETPEGKESPAEEKGSDGADPVRGLAAVFLFMLLYFARGEEFGGRKKGIWNYLADPDRRSFLLLKDGAELLLPAAAAFAVIRLLGRSRPFFADLFLFLMMLILTVLWVRAFALLFRKRGTYSAWAFVLFLMQAVFCPVVFDLGTIHPLLSAPGYFFPAGWYLKLLSPF